MTIIQNQSALIKYILGEQEILKDRQYRLLNFCLVKEYNNKLIIFNNLTKELVFLEDEESKFIISKKFDVDSPIIKQLIKKWFLVPDQNDDILLSRQVTNLAKQFEKNKKLSLYDIVTTTTCNARCFYCFEAGVEAVTMSKKTAIDIAQFIIKNYNGKIVKINWFGGEPLCNKAAINTITDYLKKYNINFLTTITTNGYLFDEETTKLATSLWNVKSVQITLDGLQETYNKVKNYSNGDSNAFARVISNIRHILNNDIAVNIRLNVDNYNIYEIYNLVDYLNDLFGYFEKFTLYAHVLFENTGFVKISKTENERNAFAKEFFKLKEYIVSLGFWTKLKPLEKNVKTSFCIADNFNGVLISPQGKIGRCEHFVGDHFEDDIYTYNNSKVWTEYFDIMPKCKTCVYFPSCLRLKNCPNCKHGCYEYEQQQYILDLEYQIISAYEDYIKNNSKDKQL